MWPAPGATGNITSGRRGPCGSYGRESPEPGTREHRAEFPQLGAGSVQSSGQPLLIKAAGCFQVEAAGIEPVNKAIENPKQDALLPAIALILLGFVIPPRPTPFPRVPPLSPLAGHTGGTCAQGVKPLTDASGQNPHSFTRRTARAARTRLSSPSLAETRSVPSGDCRLIRAPLRGRLQT
jgi:hypothetical protein